MKQRKLKLLAIVMVSLLVAAAGEGRFSVKEWDVPTPQDFGVAGFWGRVLKYKKLSFQDLTPVHA